MIDPKVVEAMNRVVAAALAWRRWELDGPVELEAVELELHEAVEAYEAIIRDNQT